MSDKEDPIVLTFNPRHEGEHFDGVPRRDLTQADVDRLTPGELHNITSPGGWDRAVYETPEAIDRREAEAKAVADVEAKAVADVEAKAAAKTERLAKEQERAAAKERAAAEKAEAERLKAEADAAKGGES